MDRSKLLLSHVNRDGRGLEIGPSLSPLAPKKSGFDVVVVDHLDQAGLIEKYSAQGLDTSRIEEVDHVWKGEALSELTGETFAWILASHVLEHLPDPISFLGQCPLNADGCLALALPDKRYCFDRFRPPSTVGSMIDARGNDKPSPGQVVDSLIHYARKNDLHMWKPDAEGVYTRPIPLDGIKSALKNSASRYMDCHIWTFTPASFRLLIDQLRALDLIRLRIVDMVQHGGEFFVWLIPSASQAALPPEEAMRAVETDLRMVVNR